MSLIIKNEAADYGLGTSVGLRTGTICRVNRSYMKTVFLHNLLHLITTYCRPITFLRSSIADLFRPFFGGEDKLFSKRCFRPQSGMR